jgi:hypothetical protein
MHTQVWRNGEWHSQITNISPVGYTRSGRGSSVETNTCRNSLSTVRSTTSAKKRGLTKQYQPSAVSVHSGWGYIAGARRDLEYIYISHKFIASGFHQFTLYHHRSSLSSLSLRSPHSWRLEGFHSFIFPTLHASLHPISLCRAPGILQHGHGGPMC